MTSAKISVPPKKKIAFVCSGGGIKAGAFHLGVALALEEKGFSFLGGLNDSQTAPLRPSREISTYVGSSAGSIVAALLAAGYSVQNIFNSFLGEEPQTERDRIPKVLPKLTYTKLFKLRSEIAQEQWQQLMNLKNVFQSLLKGEWESLLEFKWLKMSGFLSTKGVEKYLSEEVLPKNSFADYRADLFVVATQLNHSRKVVFGKYRYDPPGEDPSCRFVNDVPISHACAASTALPVIFAPYVIPAGDKSLAYIDGEIRDTLSTHVAYDAGADLVFASYTHQPYHLKKELGSLTKMGIPAILVQSIYLAVEQKINSTIYTRECHLKALDQVTKYCKSQGLDDSKIKRIAEIMESALECRSEVETVYIHPRVDDPHLFFQEHFNLHPAKMSEIVRSGFRAASKTLEKYEFQ